MAQGSGLRAQGSGRNYAQKLLSVIIPAYNAEKFLVKCVESVVNQTYKNLEIILDDDGSKDSTPQICDELASKFNNIKVIRQENRGTSKTREHALSIASGEYVAFIDSDDYIDANAYEYAIKVLENNNCQSVRFGFYLVTPTGEIISEDKPKKFESDNTHDSFAYYIKNDSPAWNLWDKVYKRILFDGIDWPDLKMTEDYYVSAQLFAKTQKFMTIDKVFYYYLKNPSNISHIPFQSKSRRDTITKTSELTVNFTVNNFPEFLPEILSRRIDFINAIFTSYLNLNINSSERNEILKHTAQLMLTDCNKLILELKRQGRELYYSSKIYNFKTRVYFLLAAKAPRLYEFYLNARMKLHELTGI